MRRRSMIALTFVAAACTVGGGSTTSLSGSAGASAGEDGDGPTTAGSSDGGDASETGEAGSTVGSDSAADSGGDPSDDSGTSAGPGDSGGASSEADGDGTASSSDGGADSGGVVDGVLDVTIIAHDDCTFTTMPASISVPEGTEFTVNWISSAASEVEFDVAKIDRFNAVPIILGMEPGTAYHDEVREWCGDLFTGTFDFSLTSCFDPQYIPVDCGA